MWPSDHLFDLRDLHLIKIRKSRKLKLFQLHSESVIIHKCKSSLSHSKGPSAACIWAIVCAVLTFRSFDLFQWPVPMLDSSLQALDQSSTNYHHDHIHLWTRGLSQKMLSLTVKRTGLVKGMAWGLLSWGLCVTLDEKEEREGFYEGMQTLGDTAV